MATTYEWDVEVVAAHESKEHAAGDILDHWHQSSYQKAREAALHGAEDGIRLEIVLVRDADAGRSWAYLEDGQLPSHFTDAYGNEVARVPARYHTEVARH